jgi:uncharacterized OB-fold protein
MSKPVAARKYIPKPEELNLEFHRKAAETGTLHLQACADCGVHRHPPRYYCPCCFSARWEFVPVAGRGEVYSFVTTQQTHDPGWAEEVPFSAVVVELEEGPRVIGTLRGMEPSKLKLGQPVVVRVEPKGDEFAFIWVEPGN